MKKSLIVLGALSMFALLFVGCPNGSNTKPSSEPDTTNTTEEEEEEETVRTWAAAETSPATDNGDGTCSITVKSQYSGGGMVVYLNEDKSDVEVGKTVTLDFDYEVVEGSWSDDSLYPKFAATLGKDITSIWSITACSGTNYKNGDGLSGSLTMDLESTAVANEVFLKFNAYEWTGDTENDQVKITLKSITIN
ncbi:MAG: hypothetical protein K5829_05400 [Treponema sp.]|nr:hypothetical protein [Treponema sp.]